MDRTICDNLQEKKGSLNGTTNADHSMVLSKRPSAGYHQMPLQLWPTIIATALMHEAVGRNVRLRSLCRVHRCSLRRLAGG